MLSTYPLAIAGCAVLTAGLAALSPAVIRRLPEPLAEQPGESPAGRIIGADEAAVDGLPVGPAGLKILYADLADSPFLASRLGVLGAGVGAVIGARLWPAAVVSAWLYLGAVGVALAYVDARTRLLPTRMIAPSYAVVVTALACAALVDGSAEALVRAGLGWLALGGFYLLLWLLYPAGIGYGDVRLAGLLGLALGYLGWAEVVTGMYAGFLLGAIGGLLLAATRLVDSKRYPFAPFMLLGSLVGLVWGPALADWYTAW